MASDGDSFIKFQHAEKVVNYGGSGAIYGLGVVGAFIYFMQHATGFWSVIWGVVQAIFWPAVMVYKALELLKL